MSKNRNENNNGNGRRNEVQWPKPIGKEGFYGIAGEFVDLVAAHTEADRNAILLSFLVYAGNIMGRDYHVPTGADRHCGNIYLCLVGPTAGGRKGSAISAAEQFFIRGEHRICTKENSPHILRGISSGEGVIWKIHDEIKKRQPKKKLKGQENQPEEFEDVTVELNEAEKRTIYCLSEFQQSLTNMKRPDSILSAIIRQAWDKDILESPSKNTAAKATGAHISLIAGITRDELLMETTGVEMAQNGTLNRFLFACCKRSKLLPEGEQFHKLTESDAWGNLQQRFRANIENKELGEIVVGRSEEAQRIWGLNECPTALYHECEPLYAKLSEMRPGLWGTITARAAQQVIRLTLINTVINGHRTMSEEDQDAAWAYWRYCDDTCRYIWGDPTDETAGVILQELRAKPGGLTRGEIYGLFNGHSGKGDIDKALFWLGEKELAYGRQDTPGGRGRPGERWFPL